MLNYLLNEETEHEYAQAESIASQGSQKAARRLLKTAVSVSGGSETLGHGGRIRVAARPPRPEAEKVEGVQQLIDN